MVPTPQDGSLPPVARPDGRVYRPRKLVVQCWSHEWAVTDDWCGVVVLGTHDAGVMFTASDCPDDDPEFGAVKVSGDAATSRSSESNLKGPTMELCCDKPYPVVDAGEPNEHVKACGSCGADVPDEMVEAWERAERPAVQRPPAPPGRYARGGRSPIVWVLLCAECAGYSPLTAEDYQGFLSGRCAGCGTNVRELHRFPAWIDTAVGCQCSGGHRQVRGDMSAGESIDVGRDARGRGKDAVDLADELQFTMTIARSGRGPCPTCGRDISLTKKGTVRVHRVHGAKDVWPPIYCLGSGQAPTADNGSPETDSIQVNP